MNRRVVVKDNVEAMLAEKLDAPLKLRGFSRRKRSTAFVREGAEAKQTIDITYDVGPRYAREAEAHVLPGIKVLFPQVNEVALQMVGGDARILGGGGATLGEPIDFVAPKSETPRWLAAGIEGFLTIGDDIRVFIERWAIPFLDEYQTVRALVQGYERSDWRLLLTQHSHVYIAAAYVVLGHGEVARDIVEKKLGAPGLRKQFSAVFEYFDREA